MRFKEYLNEQDNDLEKVFSKIEKECKPFMKDLQKIKNITGFLYSGRNTSDVWFKRKVRKNRKPLSTSKQAHEYIDNWFKENFGVNARSQSLFCTGYSDDASEYGNIYFIFPIGKYKIIWSPKVGDLFLNLNRKGILPYIKGKEEKLNEILSTYQEGNLKKAIESENEIMVICDSYYAVEWDKLIYIRDWLNTLGINYEI